MDRRTFIKTTTAAVATTALGKGANAQGSEKGPTQPNILFIMTDQQHSGMMSCTGNPWLQTPALDSLAQKGMRFERAYAANPVCVPSRISMATGMMAGRVGVFDNATVKQADKLPAQVAKNSMGELMKRAGYDTFYGGKTHLMKGLEPKQGAGYDEYFTNQREQLPGACVKFIQKNRLRPFFAVASFINPHDICFAYNAYKKREKSMSHVNELYRQAQALPLNQLPPLPDNFEVPPQEPKAINAHLKTTAVTPAKLMREDYDEREWRMYRWIYCRLTEEVDRHIGQILQGLKESGQEDNTLVLFVSDHGDMDACHALASKGLFYDESVRVPLIMKFPGNIPAGSVNQSHLINIGLDILPTFCDYADIAAPDHLIGKSMKPIAEDKQVVNWRGYVASENHWTRMIRSQRYKYCVYTGHSDRESLVDMEKDPGEMHNLVKDPNFQDVLDKHRYLLEQWVKATRDSAGDSYLV